MTIRNLTCLFSVLLAAGCNGGAGSSGAPERANTAGDTPYAGPGGETPPAEDPPAVVPSSVIVFLRGVNGSDYSSVLLSVASLDVDVDGAPVDVALANDDVDVAVQQCWALGSFAVPPPGASVHVTLALDDYGAFVRLDDSAGQIDARGLPIDLTVPSEWIANGDVSIYLDLARSLDPFGGGLVLLPQLVIRYW